jgi:hypothetical protein
MEDPSYSIFKAPTMSRISGLCKYIWVNGKDKRKTQTTELETSYSI